MAQANINDNINFNNNKKHINRKKNYSKNIYKKFDKIKKGRKRVRQ